MTATTFLVTFLFVHNGKPVPHATMSCANVAVYGSDDTGKETRGEMLADSRGAIIIEAEAATLTGCFAQKPGVGRYLGAFVVDQAHTRFSVELQ